MAWKCPVCENSENLDETLHCVCDYEITEGDLEKYRVEPGRFEEFSEENRLGKGSQQFNTLITSLEAFSFAAFLASEFLATRKVAAIVSPSCLLALMIFVTTESIIKQQVSIRYYVIKKEQVPSAYNMVLFIYFIIGLTCLAKLTYELIK